MSFKIYTYANPYQLDKADFWEEIKDLPHFCSSSVMAQSLWALFGDQFGSYFWAIDDLVEIVYAAWYGDIERHIAQYIAVSRQIKQWAADDQKSEVPNPNLFTAIRYNQGELIDALRLLVELDIDVESLHPEQANPEQKRLIHLYQAIKHSDSPLAEVFKLDSAFGQVALNTAIDKVCKKSLEREIAEQTEDEKRGLPASHRKERIARLQTLQTSSALSRVKRLVVHGVHQFTPLQLRLIARLDELGLEVVFLYNDEACGETKEIYSTWDRLYRLFGVPIHHDRQQTPCSPERHPLSNQFAQVFAALHSNQESTGETRTGWIEVASQIELLAFGNVTEMANYVARFFDDACRQSEERPIYAMQEKIYSAGKEVDELLRIYYPEQAGDRHFLCYPIGHFFMALYRLWNEETGSITIDMSAIRECATSGLLNYPEKDHLVHILETLLPYIEDVDNLDGLLERLDHYILQYRTLLESGVDRQRNLLSRIPFYNRAMITPCDAEVFRAFVLELNELAVNFFIEDGKPRESFVSHFQKLSEFIEVKSKTLANEEERKLIDSLLERFSEVSLRTTLKGGLEDLKRGLYYYLRQKGLDKPEWIVRNFVQIEGDILSSKAQSRRETVPTYHFACLSDRLMTRRNDDILPWPLTDHFVRTAYSPNALIFQVYYTALSDHQAFIRYALYYGLNFNYCPVRLSYIQEFDDRAEELFFPLKLLGMEPKMLQGTSRSYSAATTRMASVASASERNYYPSPYERMDFFLCPYKYYMDFVCQNGIVYGTRYLIHKYYVSILIEKAWQKMQGSLYSQARAKQVLSSEQENLKVFFPFLREANDLHDLQNTARNYIENWRCKKGVVDEFDEDHINVRHQFHVAKLSEPEGQLHPYNSFEKKVTKDEEHRIYSLYSVKQNDQALRRDMLTYMRENKGQCNVTGAWCNNCSHKNTCMKAYREVFTEFLTEEQ